MSQILPDRVSAKSIPSEQASWIAAVDLPIQTADGRSSISINSSSFGDLAFRVRLLYLFTYIVIVTTKSTKQPLSPLLDLNGAAAAAGGARKGRKMGKKGKGAKKEDKPKKDIPQTTAAKKKTLQEARKTAMWGMVGGLEKACIKCIPCHSIDWHASIHIYLCRSLAHIFLPSAPRCIGCAKIVHLNTRPTVRPSDLSLAQCTINWLP